MLRPYLFQVFVDEKGSFGNPGSLVIDERHRLNEKRRSELTGEIGHEETVFLDDIEKNKLSIYHSLGRINFAGSVLVGVAWQLSLIKKAPVETLQCDAGEIQVWQEGEVSWLRASLNNNLGDWNYQQLGSPDEVNAINVADTKDWKKMVWAWENEEKGLIRARTFASKINIPEVRGNGSGAMNLAGQLQRYLQITHGDGSVIFASPAPDNCAELGGRVIPI